jgi:hypothetical protein
MFSNLAGEDYAGAVSADRGRCFRYVHDVHGKPERCSAAIIGAGWLYASTSGSGTRSTPASAT